MRNKILLGLSIYLLSLALLGCTFLYVSSTMEYIIQRDPSFYWDRSYSLWMTLRSDGFIAWLKVILFSLGENHTYLPSAIPSLVFAIFGTDSMNAYGLTVIVLYLAPIPAVGAFVPLGARVSPPLETFAKGVVLLAAMYPFAVRLMPTSPDFGGNLLVSIALCCAGIAFTRAQSTEGVAAVRPVALGLFGFFLALCVAVFFRRWYAFNAVGLSLATAMGLLVVSRRGGAGLGQIMKALVIAGVGTGILLSPILLQKLMVVSSAGIFEGAYDAYRTNYVRTFDRFGIVELIGMACVAFVALAVHRRESRAFLVTVIVGNAIGVLFFLYIQAPGIHHFSLLWPALLVSCAAIVERLATMAVLPARPWLGIISALILAAAVVLQFPAEPKVDPQIAGYRMLADKIVSKGLKQSKFCVLGNEDIYYSVVDNLWQVRGGYRGALPRPVRIPEVDFGTADRYANGGLLRALSACEWIIGMEKLGLHHQPKFHRILRYHHEKIFDQSSILGQAYEKEDQFEAGFGNPVVFFRRRDGTELDPEAIKADYLAWLARDKQAYP